MNAAATIKQNSTFLIHTRTMFITFIFTDIKNLIFLSPIFI
jgi:hypothetical protein